MPSEFEIAREQWARYVYARDTGHREFVAKAHRCDDFFVGMQWDPAVVAELAASRRPALTINKMLITLSSVFGEQIDLRSETAFRPRFGAPAQNADILTKTFRFIGDQNQLNWKRSEVFADGCVTSRGFYDIRLTFKENTAGEVTIDSVNPKMVIPDPDASKYDPDEWNDVIVTSWVTPDDITLMFDKSEAAERLSHRTDSHWDFGYDSLDIGNDRFGGRLLGRSEMGEGTDAVHRSIRLIDRQHRVMTKMKYLVDPKTGDKMRIPDQWGREEIAYAVQTAGLIVVSELGKRVRWTVTAEEMVMHDEWSPFERFSIVPYFPHFRHGRTVGIVETLIDPQELLNKTLSQELHVVNTMANSGWKYRSGALVNMTPDELESQGAKTGLVLEVNGDPDKDVVKILPNSIPQGLERLSFKAENYIKTVSGRGDSQLGLDRADVSGRAIGEKKESSDVNIRVVLDSLERSDWFMARSILDIIQKFYTDARIMHVTRGEVTGEYDEVKINVPDPQTGEILNDLTLGTYDVSITSQSAKRTLEETEFAQALGLREIGILIPDRFMLMNSNLREKEKIIKQMEEEAKSPEAIAKAKAEMMTIQLQVANLKADASKSEAEAAARRAKAVETMVNAKNDSEGEPGEQQEMLLKKQEHDQEMQMEREKHEFELQKMREEHALKQQLQKAEAAEKRRTQRIQAAVAVSQAKNAPAQPAAQGASA